MIGQENNTNSDRTLENQLTINIMQVNLIGGADICWRHKTSVNIFYLRQLVQYEVIIVKVFKDVKVTEKVTFGFNSRRPVKLY